MKLETLLLLLGAAGVGYFLFRGQGTLPGNVAMLPPLPAVPFLAMNKPAVDPIPAVAASTPPPPKPGDACQVKYNAPAGTNHTQTQTAALDGSYTAAGVCARLPTPFDWMN